MAPRIARILLVMLVTSSCAYGYAGKEGKRRSEREYKRSVRVVTIEEKEEEEEAVDTKVVTEPAEPESPCGRPTFEIFYYTGSTQVTKTVDCKRRTIVGTQSADISPSAARSAGLPESSWYLLVDPKGTGSEYLNNAQLLKLSRAFTIDYYGRDTARDLLVYLYQQEDVQ